MPAPVQEGPIRNEADLRLVSLLQIDPRISWSKAGEILQMSPTTTANRWNYLVEKGPIWICTYPSPGRRFIAAVEVDCRTEFLPSVTKQMCAHPLIMSVDEVTGWHDILLTVVAPDTTTLTALIIDWIRGIGGMYGTCSSLMVNVIAGAESWRTNILTQCQVNRALLQCAPDRSQTGFDAADLALAQALARDDRASVASPSQELDMPTDTVHHRARRLLANQRLIMRCDTAPEPVGRLLECTWLTTVAFNYRNRVIELPKEQPSLRSCFWITGNNNLHVNFRVNHISFTATFESSIAPATPGLAPDETVVHMHSHKSMGWLLRPDDSCIGQLVPPVFDP